METIHQRLKRLREAKGLSMSALARTLTIKYQAVQAWEKGRSAPTRKLLPLVADALGVTPQEIVGGASTASQSAPKVDPLVLEIAALFQWLTNDQKKQFLADLRETAKTNRAIAKELPRKGSKTLETA